MPEGHTIHRLATQLDSLLTGLPVRAASPQGRFSGGAELLDGAVCTGTYAYGKHLFVGFEPEYWLHVHLGLYGRWEVSGQPAAPPRGAVRLRLETDASCLDLRGPTACAVVDSAEKRSIQTRLGPDPLRGRPRPENAYARIGRSPTPIGALLMDQKVLAGVGNVYRAEILFRAGMSPFRPGRDVSRAEWDVMWDDLRRLMRAGVRAGRIITTRSEHRPGRRGGVRVEDSHYVYRRTGLPCRMCGTPVSTTQMVGRNLYWCALCQAR